MGRIRTSSPESDAFADITKRLRRYRSLVANYQACKELRDSLFPSCTQTLTDMPKGGGDTFEPERWAQRRWDLSDRMDKSLEEMRAEYEKLEDLVNLVTSDYNTVLTRRYLLGESWEVIAQKLNCDRTTAWRWHNGAIRKLINLQHHATLKPDIITL